jgi:c-di-GMP-related signal transduction protein
MRPQSPAVFLGRQPILNRQGLVVAYELLFRASTGQDVVHITDDSHASMNVITHAFRHFGSSAVVGESKAFINFNAQLLMSNVIEAPPQDRVVIELLETVDMDDELIPRCRDLKAQG